MPRAVRRILAVVAGMIAGMVMVMLSDSLVGWMSPLPAGINMRDSVAMHAAVMAMPATSLMTLAIGWAVAAFVGAWVAVRLTPDRWLPAGYTFVTLHLAATVWNLVEIRHPVYVWVLALLLIPLLGWLGVRTASAPVSAPAASPA